MKNKQRGFIGNSLERALAFSFILVAVASAVVGWGLIEGVIWIFKHLTIGWVA